MNNMHKIPTLLIFRRHKLITDGIEIVLAPRLNNLAKHKTTMHVIAMFVSRRHATDSGGSGCQCGVVCVLLAYEYLDRCRVMLEGEVSVLGI